MGAKHPGNKFSGYGLVSRQAGRMPSASFVLWCWAAAAAAAADGKDEEMTSLVVMGYW